VRAYRHGIRALTPTASAPPNASAPAADQYIASRQNGFGAKKAKLGHSTIRNMLAAPAM
jgi:hypothetical protein